MPRRRGCRKSSSRSTINVKLDVPIGDLAVHEPDYKRLIAFLKAMEFNSLTRRVAEFAGIDAATIEPDAQLSVRGASVTLARSGEGTARARAAELGAAERSPAMGRAKAGREGRPLRRRR